MSVQEFTKARWESLLEPPNTSLETICAGKLYLIPPFDDTPPGAMINVPMGDAFNDRFRPWATAVQIILQNFVSNIQCLQAQMSQGYRSVLKGFTSGEISTLASQAPQGITTLDDAGTVLVLVNARASSSPFINHLLAPRIAQKIDQQVSAAVGTLQPIIQNLQIDLEKELP